jgi:hypothetical protein
MAVGLSAKHFSPCLSFCLLNLILGHPHSDLMFDGDCRGKLDLSSEPVCVHQRFLPLFFDIVVSYGGV